MPLSEKIAIAGGGSWATALVKILSNHCTNISWWVRREETVEYIRNHKHNPNYLSDVQIDTDRVFPTTDINGCLSGAGIVILAIPSAFLKGTLSGMASKQLSDKLVFSAIKGIIPDDLMVVGDYLVKKMGVSENKIGVITGPCHAEEVALEKLSYLTIACKETAHAQQLADRMQCRYIRTTVSDDIYGTEYAAVIKNIMAIAVGMCHGLGYGDNFQAVLISNAIGEIRRFVDMASPVSRDINDSAYLGDLLVTAYSQFSRNRTFGNMIGKGYSVKAAQLEMNMVAEGYYAAACIHEMNKTLKASIPVCETVYRVLYENAPARQEMMTLAESLR